LECLRHGGEKIGRRIFAGHARSDDARRARVHFFREDHDDENAKPGRIEWPHAAARIPGSPP
jgi:hypothetical protein